MRRAGRLLVAGCLRPWAERLIEAVRPAAGDSCVDLCSDGGVLSRSLSSAVGPSGMVLVVDTDSGAACAETEGARGQVLAAVASPVTLPVASETADVAVSLFGLAHCGDVRGAVVELKRVVRPRIGRAAIVLWAGAEGAPHEVAATTALQQETGVLSAFIREALTAAETLRADDHGLPVVRLRDVVRFDSADHLWRALVDERPSVASELDGVPPADLAAARRACAGLIAPYCQRDGTIRIPVEAVMLTGGQPWATVLSS